MEAGKFIIFKAGITMIKKYSSFLLAFLEIGLLAFLTPTIFWKIVLSIGPIETYILGHYTYLWLSAAIATVSVAGIIFILIQRFVKNVHIKIAVIWGILILAASVITNLFAPFIIGGAS
jgi:hypothetical protein